MPARADRLGEPEIVGARFELAVREAVISNEGSERNTEPSPTEILILPQRPVCEGLPVSRPVLVEKLAQYGLFVM